MSTPHPKFKLNHQLGDKIPTRQFVNANELWLKENTSKNDRERALADIVAYGDEDNAEAAAADLAREFPPTWSTLNS